MFEEAFVTDLSDNRVEYITAVQKMAARTRVSKGIRTLVDIQTLDGARTFFISAEGWQTGDISLVGAFKGEVRPENLVGFAVSITARKGTKIWEKIVTEAERTYEPDRRKMFHYLGGPAEKIGVLAAFSLASPKDSEGLERREARLLGASVRPRIENKNGDRCSEIRALVARGIESPSSLGPYTKVHGASSTANQLRIVRLKGSGLLHASCR